MNNPERMWNAAVLCACCLILMPYASADGLPDEGHFTYVTLSNGGLDNGVLHRLVMNGRGHFDADDGEANGGGEFIHFDGNSGPPPLTLIASGTWEVTEFISWAPFDQDPNPYGQVIAGTLVMEVRLFPNGNDDDGIPAILTVVCNVPPAGINTGMPEGIFLAIDGGLFFEPILVPTAIPSPTMLSFGLTLITVGDDDDDSDSDSDSDSD